MSGATERIAEGAYEVNLEAISKAELSQVAHRILTMSHKVFRCLFGITRLVANVAAMTGSLSKGD